MPSWSICQLTSAGKLLRATVLCVNVIERSWASLFGAMFSSDKVSFRSGLIKFQIKVLWNENEIEKLISHRNPLNWKIWVVVINYGRVISDKQTFGVNYYVSLSCIRKGGTVFFLHIMLKHLKEWMKFWCIRLLFFRLSKLRILELRENHLKTMPK